MSTGYQVLHISTYYSRNKLYRSLVKELSSLGWHQNVYVPCRLPSDIGRYELTNTEGVNFLFDLILKKRHKILFHSKIAATYKSIVKNSFQSGAKLVHAHSLFSDGAVALKLNESFDLPYVVAVRSTDINTFFKKALHLRKHGVRILESAQKIIFLNHEHKSTLLRNYVPSAMIDRIERKSLVIPNGLSEFWLEECQNKRVIKEEVNFLYVGNFRPLKNLPFMLKVLDALAKKNQNKTIVFKIVGGGGRGGLGQGDPEIESALTKLESRNLKVSFIGQLEDQKKLRDLYRWADLFIMLSKRETFGMVYLEALSQSTPIISTKGQGISSYLKDMEGGISVDIESLENSVTQIEKVIEEYDSISVSCFAIAKRFGWPSIAMKYSDIYEKIITN